VSLPDGPWYDALTGRTVDGGPLRLTDLLAPLPVALLVRT
jgi:(1->4)-alpha-D-glucan 1-alpha-D-glucosylmutase